MCARDRFRSSMNWTIRPGVPTRILQLGRDWRCCFVSEPPVARHTLILDVVVVNALRTSDICTASCYEGYCLGIIRCVLE